MKATLRNKLTMLALPACAAILLLGTASTQAAGYLKIGGIDGESTDAAHDKWIEVLSVSQSITRPLIIDPATGQRTRGDTTLGDVVVVKELDKSSPKLAEAICTGAIYPEIEIHYTKEFTNADGSKRQEPYLKYKLKDVIVTSYSFHGNAAGDPLPTEEVTLGYTEVEWTYIVLDPAGVPSETIVGVCGNAEGTP